MKPTKKWKTTGQMNLAVERAMELGVHSNSLACVAPPAIVPRECPSSWNDQFPPDRVAVHRWMSQIHQQIIPDEL